MRKFTIGLQNTKGDFAMDNTHRIVPVKGHYEVHDSNGKFVLSGDTYEECYNDLVDMLVVEARMENIRERVSA